MITHTKSTSLLQELQTEGPWRVFYYLLNISGLKSVIIPKENVSEGTMKRRRFLQALAKELSRDQMKYRINVKSKPLWIKNRLWDLLGVENQALPSSAEQLISGRCYLCDWRKNWSSKTRCRTCKVFICKEHSARVGPTLYQL